MKRMYLEMATAVFIMLLTIGEIYIVWKSWDNYKLRKRNYVYIFCAVVGVFSTGVILNILYHKYLISR